MRKINKESEKIIRLRMKNRRQGYQFKDNINKKLKNKLIKKWLNLS